MSEKVGDVGGYVGREFYHITYTGVRKVYITYSSSRILHIKVDYDKDGKVVTRQDGNMNAVNRVQRQQNEVLISKFTNFYFFGGENAVKIP